MRPSRNVNKRIEQVTRYATPYLHAHPFPPSFMKKYLLSLLVLPFLATSCSKSDSNNAAPSATREYQVEYRITGTNVSSAQLVYRDLSGNQITDGLQTLPKSYSFKRTMGPSESIGCGAFLDAAAPSNATVTAIILLDGKQVKTETGTGANAQAVPVYLIP